MARQWGWLVGSLVLASFILLGILGQNASWAATGDTAQAEPDQDLIKVRIHTDTPEAEAGVFHLKKKIAIIEPVEGFVEILTRDSRLTAQRLVYDQSEDQAELTGNVTITQKDVDAQAKNMKADFAREKYVLEGNVYLKQRESEGETAGATKIEVWSQWMQVEEAGKRVLARGKVRLIEADRKAWADELDYDDGQERAVLTGDVRLETNDGSVLTGTKVVINLSTDEAVVYGPTYAEFTLESDDTSEDDQ
ncbi:MAG: hypothetical protein GX998_11400 [Firmicutes bacterium]|nr:hypothetical protein [Bacillota bacterium]